MTPDHTVEPQRGREDMHDSVCVCVSASVCLCVCVHACVRGDDGGRAGNEIELVIFSWDAGWGWIGKGRRGWGEERKNHRDGGKEERDTRLSEKCEDNNTI